MHVLITNDDGPLNTEFSPYIRPFIQNLIKIYPDWTFTVLIPNVQKSWYAKSHIAGHSAHLQFIYSDPTAKDNSFIGPFIQPQRDSKFLDFPNVINPEIPNNYIEWCLLDGSPASCANIGIHNLSKRKKFDLVISGPNVGRNTSAAYITSSATVGAAMEAVISGNTPSIALSWAYINGNKFTHNENNILNIASIKSLQIINHIWKNWNNLVDLYSINIPLSIDLSLETRCFFAPIWENRWTSIFKGPIINKINNNSLDIMDSTNSRLISFGWNPDFETHSDSKWVNKDIKYDMHIIDNGHIAITPLRATFKDINSIMGELKLDDIDIYGVVEKTQSNIDIAITINHDDYIYQPISRAIKKYIKNAIFIESDKEIIQMDPHDKKILQYGDYEQLNLDYLSNPSSNYFANSYIYRKALIRKHYLAHTIHNYITKNTNSILKKATLESFTIDLDYAEFLDDSLDENWELRQELQSERKWWIVKPSMSDKGQGIRIFKTINQLQEIFDSFDEGINTDDEDEDHDNSRKIDDNKIIISQLRHFIIQEYLSNPLLLPSMDNKKFHIRCYITCKGDLEVFVYDRMLALFAPAPFKKLIDINDVDHTISSDSFDPTDLTVLQSHLTNTCLQIDENTKQLSVIEFDKLADISDENKLKIKNQIHEIAHDLFLAALSVNRLNFQPLPNAFETYGVDFLVDDNYNVKILEVNAYPDFKQTGDSLKGLIDELFENITLYCIKPLLTDVDDTNPNESSNFVKVLDYTSNEW